jgi:hypothetical protein
MKKTIELINNNLHWLIYVGAIIVILGTSIYFGELNRP